MSQTTNNNAVSTAFVSFDGLAGDVHVVKARIAQRDHDIAILDQQVIALDEEYKWQEQAIYIPSLETDQKLEKEIQALQKKREKLNRETARRVAQLATKHQSVRNPVYQHLSFLQAENDYDRQLIAPIKKLPTEILCHIFCTFVALGGSPLLLTKVNKGWEEKALVTHELWTHISFKCTLSGRGDVQEGHRISGMLVYSEGRKVICHDINSFRLVLSLTGVLSLHLDFVLQRHNDGTPTLLLALSDASVSSRIVSLKIDDEGFTTPNDLHFGPLSNLQRFSLKCDRATLGNAIMESIKCSRASPTHVKLRVAAKFPVILPSVRRFWKDLQLLDLGGCSTPEQLNEVARHMQCIETLRGCPSQWPDAATPTLRLPYLTVLELTGKVRRDRLELPVIRHLQVVDIRR